jgi:hypothetical protein
LLRLHVEQLIEVSCSCEFHGRTVAGHERPVGIAMTVGC